MSIFAMDHFDIDVHTGFLPPEPPLMRLGPAYHVWEDLLDQGKTNARTLRDHLGAIPPIPSVLTAWKVWRDRVGEMLILPTIELEEDVRQTRRAHHVLSFLTQFFVQSLPPRDPSLGRTPIVIPAPLAIPFVAVSRHLGIAPIVTYADTVLWNWEKKDPSLPLTRNNIRMVDLFTGSPQEEHFFRTSALVEIRGWEALDAMEHCVREASLSAVDRSHSSITHHLLRLATALDDITTLLLAVKTGLDPLFFYYQFRPWIQGADQGVDSPSWHYEGVDGVGLTLQCSGPSAGQSALMHSFDVFLGVPHEVNKKGLGGGCTRFNASLNPHSIEAAQDREIILSKMPADHPPVPSFALPLTPPPSPSTSPIHSLFPIATSAPIDTSFNARMRSYMSKAHEDFLQYLAQRPIRALVLAVAVEEGELVKAYDASVMALKRWRDAHILIVTQFVIIPARSVNKIPKTRFIGEERIPVRGTGGTSLIPLLKIYRGDTLRQVVRKA